MNESRGASAGGGAPRQRNGGGDPAVTRTHADPSRRLAPGTVLAGRYEVIDLVGVGGMGLVYRARDRELDLDVALKVLRPDLGAEGLSLDRFRRELVLARQVSHRNVVRIHDIGQDGELYFLTMDLVQGRSLRDLLEERGPLPVERAVTIAAEVADGLAAAHERGVVHRDLKPGNILVDEADGRAFITDFGVARSLVGSGMTQAGTVVGTPDYLAPEQARGGDVGPRADLYALGVILFEMLTGELPFPSGSYHEILAQRIHGRPRDLTAHGLAAPPGLRRIVRRCLERSPRRRWGSAEELGVALRALDGAPGRRRTGLHLAMVTGVVALVVAAGWTAWRLVSLRAGSEAIPTASLAALPFVDQTGRDDLAWLGGGLSEMLAERLSEQRALRVVDGLRTLQTLDDLRLEGAPTSAELEQVAGVLGVDRLLTGNVRTLGEDIELDAVLVRLEAGEIAERTSITVQGPPSDLPGLVGSAATAVARRLALAAPRPAGPVHRPPPEALREYTAAVRDLSRGRAVAAAPALERAVAADPRFAAAWLRLADAEQEIGRHDRALDAAARAVATVPTAERRLSLEARAEQLLLQGRPDRASEVLARLVGEFPGDTEAGIRLAEALAQAGRLDDAIARLEKVVAIDATFERAWYLLGKDSILSGRSQKAVEDYLVRALVLANNQQSLQAKADVLNAFGVGYRDLGKLDAAREDYEKAATLRRELGDRRGYATTLRNLAQIDTLRGDYAKAQESLDRALGILTELGDSAGIADLSNDRGILAEERGDYPQALAAYRTSLQTRRDLGDQRAIAESLNNVGYAYYLLGEYDNSMVYWHQALDLYRQAHNQEGVVLATQSVGLLQLVQGDWQAAVSSFATALDASRKLGMKDAEAVSLGNLGRLAALAGRFPAALASYEKALAGVRELEDTRGMVEFTLAEAEIDLELGAQDRAEELLGQAAQWLAAGGNTEQEAQLARLQGEHAIARGDLTTAETKLALAVRLASESHMRGALLAAGLARARVDLARRQPAAARRRLERLIDEARQLGHVPLELAIGEELARSQLASGHAAEAEATLREVLRVVAAAGPYARAFRLHGLLARVLAARGEPGSEVEAERAGDELARVRQALPGELRETFDRLPEVRAVADLAATGRAADAA